jgi:hypothetical protein
MEYGDFESKLAILHKIPPEQIKAFRSRLRVLRDHGIPSVHKPGKGAKVVYHFNDFWEAHLALTLQNFGLPLKRVHEITRLAPQHWRQALKEIKIQSTEDVWLALAFTPVGDRDPQKIWERQRYKNGSDPLFEIKQINKTTLMHTMFGPLSAITGTFKHSQSVESFELFCAVLNLSQLTRRCEAIIGGRLEA